MGISKDNRASEYPSYGAAVPAAVSVMFPHRDQQQQAEYHINAMTGLIMSLQHTQCPSLFLFPDCLI